MDYSVVAGCEDARRLGQLYWGSTPLPADDEILGLVELPDGQRGALLRLHRRLFLGGHTVYAKGVAGELQALPTEPVYAALFGQDGAL